MMKKANVDKRLERDPRYAAAKARLIELQVQLSTAEKERDDLQSGINSLASRALDALNAEAQALLSGAQAPDSAINQRQKLADSLGQIDHQVAVLRQAVLMQRQKVADLTAEVSRAICADVESAHNETVRAEIAAVIALAEARGAEADILDCLRDNGVQFAGALRPMLIRGFDLSDRNSLASQFLLECVRLKRLSVSQLPIILRAHVPPGWLVDA
jgi:hypothetical protein